MLSPSIALLASIAGILVLIRLKAHPGLAIFIGSLILSLLTLPLNSVPPLMQQSLLNYQTIRLLVVIASALTLSSLMEERGLLAKLATTMEGIGPRFAMHLVPAIIGLVPMPAGALVSATTVRGLVKRLRLTPEQGTFINYWFRHIWEFSIPIYPSIITASVILSIPIFSVVKTLSPMTALAIASGTVLSYAILKKTSKTDGEPRTNIVRNLLEASWPILLLVVLILVRVDAIIAFPVTLALLIGQQRAKRPELKKAFKYGLNPKILLFLYAIMLYKTTIESSGTAGALVSDMQAIGLPSFVMLVALPLLIGLATGIGIAFVGITFPLLAPYIVSSLGINSHALLLAFVSGMMGMLLSPLHLCLVLSVEYFKANLTKVYRYILPLCLVIEAVAILIYHIAA
ncbi:DUF401 family protein [Chloroflexota bacterium]